jgi:hypothetical protein
MYRITFLLAVALAVCIGYTSGVNIKRIEYYDNLNKKLEITNRILISKNILLEKIKACQLMREFND